MKGKLKLIGKRVLQVLASVCLALVVVEAGLRFFAPQEFVTDGLLYESAQGNVGYRLQPNLTIPAKGSPTGWNRVNALGLRGAEIGTKQAKRVIVLGDSFVFGAGVEVHEALSGQLSVADSGTEYLNVGTPGYGTVRELAWLEDYGDQLDGDELILCLFAGNDFSDNLVGRAPRIVDGKLFLGEFDTKASETSLRARAFWRSMHLVRLIERRRLAADDPGAAPDKQPGRQVTAAQRTERMLQLNTAFARKQAERLEPYLPRETSLGPAAGRVQLAYDLTQLAVEGLAAWCSERGVRFSVVLIPDVLVADAEVRARTLEQGAFARLGAFDLAGLDFERPGREVRVWCEGLEASFLDLTPSFSQRTEALKAADSSSKGLYLFGDSHWNAAGHAFAAEQILAWRAGLKD